MKWSPEDWGRLGVQIRKAREEQGLSRRKLSELSGISEKSIQLTEEGRVPTRWPKSLHALEDALGWSSPSSVLNILAGDEPTYVPKDRENPYAQPDLTSRDYIDVDVDRLRYSSVTDNILLDHFLDRYGVKTEELPSDIAMLVPMIGEFSNRCSGLGVSQRLVTSFEGMAAIMLGDVAKRHQEKVQRKAQQTPEEAEAYFEDAMRRIHQESVNLREILVRRLEEERASPADRKHRDADIRFLERGLRELDEVIERSSSS